MLCVLKRNVSKIVACLKSILVCMPTHNMTPIFFLSFVSFFQNSTFIGMILHSSQMIHLIIPSLRFPENQEKILQNLLSAAIITLKGICQKLRNLPFVGTSVCQ